MPLTLIFPILELLAPHERGLTENCIRHPGRTKCFPCHETHARQVVQLHLQKMIIKRSEEIRERTLRDRCALQRSPGKGQPQAPSQALLPRPLPLQGHPKGDAVGGAKAGAGGGAGRDGHSEPQPLPSAWCSSTRFLACLIAMRL